MECKKMFGEIMHTARKKRGIKLSELAELVGVSEVYCGNIENGVYTPTWIIWLKICAVLNIDICELREGCIRSEINETAKTMGIKL